MKKQTNEIYQTVIIGAGFAGIGAAIRLKKNGFDNFIVLERASELGGTWRENIYPGCGCDVQSHLYSYSFDLNPGWTRNFSKQEEILNYIQSSAEKHGIIEHIHFQQEITSLQFNEKLGHWHLSSKSGQSYLSKSVIAALGPLNVPLFPIFHREEIFGGVSFHSSEWNSNFDPSEKKVAIVGTGASAIQLVPELAKTARQLYVFQRTPPWVLPKADGIIPNYIKQVFKTIPGVLWLWREMIYWFMELRGIGLFGNKLIAKIATWIALRHIKSSISDPALRAQVTPSYQIGCKRVLPSNDYYPSLELPNVELVTDQISELEHDGIACRSGRKVEVDCIVYATGFAAAEYSLRNFDAIGIDGRSLMDEWKVTGPEAYYGMAVSGYPGLLFMSGPNTGLGHNSIIHMMESQINYILDYLRKLSKNESEASYFDLKKEIQEEHNKQIQRKLSGMVWTSGCQSWYQTSSGKNTTLWPGHTFTYRRRTKRVNLADYNLIDKP